LQKAGFKIVRQAKPIVMSNGQRIVTIPRHNPVNAFTIRGIARDAELCIPRQVMTRESSRQTSMVPLEGRLLAHFRSRVTQS
jgi:hypothetical protein